MPGLIDWFTVTFDDKTVFLCASPPGREPWTQQFGWDSIIRICFETEGVFGSDGIYVFTTQRPESYVIPTEAVGAPELWGQIIDRKLFDAKLAVQIMTANSGLYCWPPKDPPPPLAVIDYYAPPITIKPLQRKIGMIIVIAALIPIGLLLTWNLFHCITLGYLTMFQGVQFVISIWLMIGLWRGSAIARWLTFILYGLPNGFFMVGMLIFGSIQMSMPYFEVTAWILILLATLLVLPWVGWFQRSQRQFRQ